MDPKESFRGASSRLVGFPVRHLRPLTLTSIDIMLEIKSRQRGRRCAVLHFSNTAMGAMGANLISSARPGSVASE
jgi:hypothetical protein